MVEGRFACPGNEKGANPGGEQQGQQARVGRALRGREWHRFWKRFALGSDIRSTVKVFSGKGHARQDVGWYWTRSDSDQDRPN